MADDLKRFEVIVQHGEGVLFPWEVVESHVALAVELFEGVKDVESLPDRPPAEALCLRVRVEVLGFHVKHPGGGLEFGFVDGGFEGLGAEVKVAVPGDRLLIGRFGAEVGAQCVLVLAEDARNEHTRVRQGGVCKGLTCLAQWVGLFDLKGLEVENGQHAVHGRARPVARLPVVVVLDDVGAVAHAHKLRVVRPLDLRCADPHEPLHHEVPSQRRIPVPGQQAGCRGARLLQC